GAVVARIVPGEAALIERVLPEADHEFHGFDRLLAVEHHGLAVGFDFPAAPRPQIRIGKRRRVAEGVTERLPDRPAHRLELLASFAQGPPGVREFALRISDLLAPAFSLPDLPPDSPPRHP